MAARHSRPHTKLALDKRLACASAAASGCACVPFHLRDGAALLARAQVILEANHSTFSLSFSFGLKFEEG